MTLKALKPTLAMISACGIWGLSGIYYDRLSHIPPFEVLAHRSLWAMVFFSGFLFYQRRVSNLLKNQITARELYLLCASALLISINWFSFIFAIQTSQAVQASFGYYIFPLVAVILSIFFKGERFSKVQLLAIIFAAISVASLGFALRLIPTVALIIAISGIYIFKNNK